MLERRKQIRREETSFLLDEWGSIKPLMRSNRQRTSIKNMEKI